MPKSPEQFEPRIKKETPKPLEKEKKISPEEYQERLERLKNMGRVIGEDFDMAVEAGEKPGWRYLFKPVNKIEVDPNDVAEKGLDYCFGVISHEGAHRKISEVDFIPKKVWQERGFSFLMNAIEDPRVNNWVSEKYDGAKEWIEQMYNQDLSCEEKVEKTAKEKVGYVPKHIRFGLEVIKYWHTGSFSEDLPEEIKEALEKTIKYSEMAYGSTPDPKNPTEEEITESAQRAYKIVYSAIWPEYQKLVDKAYEDEKLRQKIKDMLENGEIEIKQEGLSEKGEPLPLDELPEDLREEIKKKLKEKLDSMSEEERKKFEEGAEKKAEETLDELEEDENKELKGKLTEQPETKSEEEKRKKEEEEEKKRREELEKIKEEIEKKLEAEKTEYDRAYGEVKPYIDRVAGDIINLFIRERWPKFKKGFPGQRLEQRLKGAMKYAAKKEYRELFERREKMERKEYNFLLLVDLSGSMAGDKIEETFKGAVLFAETLNRVANVLGRVKIAIYGFQNDLIEYKRFNQRMDDERREKMSIMKGEVENKGEHNQANHNNDGYCLETARRKLEELRGKNNFLFVLSDGQPNGDASHHLPGYSKATEEKELRDVVKKISQEGKTTLLGIGLGPGTEHVEDYYSKELRGVENLPNVDVKKLSEQLAKKLEEIIK